MNEKIKELAERAGYLPDMFGVGHWNMPEFQEYTKLLIQEVATICENENVSMLEIGVILESTKKEIQDLATRSCGEQLAKRIKKHFGVE